MVRHHDPERLPLRPLNFLERHGTALQGRPRQRLHPHRPLLHLPTPCARRHRQHHPPRHPRQLLPPEAQLDPEDLRLGHRAVPHPGDQLAGPRHSHHTTHGKNMDKANILYQALALAGSFLCILVDRKKKHIILGRQFYPIFKYFVHSQTDNISRPGANCLPG